MIKTQSVSDAMHEWAQGKCLLLLKPLGTNYIKLQIRQRLTADGGKSQMAA